MVTGDTVKLTDEFTFFSDITWVVLGFDGKYASLQNRENHAHYLRAHHSNINLTQHPARSGG